jgi:5-methylcytosine-specific restriction endonuclease McrA
MNKKKSNWKRNPKHVYYVSLLNSQEWQGINGLRARTLRAHPLCQLCEKQGLVVSAVDVHHLKPVEGVGPYINVGEELPEWVKAAMRERCFDEKNVIALCIPCHIEIHRQMKSHKGQMAKLMPKVENDQTRQLEGWVQQVSGGTCEARPRIKKGIRRTKYGWLTKEELKQKQAEELENWKRKCYGLSHIKDAPAMDAQSED